MARHIARVPVRRADLDGDGHVDSVVFLRYLQEARVDMLFVKDSETGAHGGGEGLADGLVVIRHEIDHRAPLRYRVEPVRVEMWISNVRGASFTVNYEVADDDGDGSRTVYARASTMLAPFDLAEQRLRRLTADEKAAFTRFSP